MGYERILLNGISSEALNGFFFIYNEVSTIPRKTDYRNTYTFFIVRRSINYDIIESENGKDRRVITFHIDHVNLLRKIRPSAQDLLLDLQISRGYWRNNEKYVKDRELISVYNLIG